MREVSALRGGSNGDPLEFQTGSVFFFFLFFSFFFFFYPVSRSVGNGNAPGASIAYSWGGWLHVASYVPKNSDCLLASDE